MHLVPGDCSMSSRAARSLLGPLVDGYRDLEPSKQGFDRPSVSLLVPLSSAMVSPCCCALDIPGSCTLTSALSHSCVFSYTSSKVALSMQTAGGNTMKKTDWENMDLGGGGGGAKAAEIFK